jgi:16S rRNA (guanine966-N2)-methyltransferase
MRVIAGRWKGRRLKSPVGDEVRPTTDRVKEALFNILGPDVRGCLFMDLCCGAGGLGIEALSREAAQVVFVDQSQGSLALVRENLATCGAELGNARLVCAEAAAWLARWQPPVRSGPWVLVADPPYRSPVAGAIMRELERLAVDPGFRLGVLEHGIRTPDLETGSSGTLDWSTRRYGGSCLAVARRNKDGPDQGE